MKKFLTFLFMSFTSLSCIYETPQWTPDGKKIICGVYYDDDKGEDQYQFFSVDIASKTATPLSEFIESKSGVAPALSPNGSLIAYFFHEDGMDENRMDLHIMKVDGSEDRKIIELIKEESRVEYTLKPWNPDGKTLAVQSFNSQKSIYEILLVDLDGAKRVLSGLDSFILPSWSPDGKSLAYLVKKEKTYDLVVTEPDSLKSRTLAEDIPLPVKRAKELLPFLVPAWSSDGKNIAYVNDHQIAVINVETTRRKNITMGKGFKVYPQWSKDSQKLVFMKVSFKKKEPLYGQSVSKLILIDREGKNPIVLSNLPGESYLPQWSPSGEKIAFLFAYQDVVSFLPALASLDGNIEFFPVNGFQKTGLAHYYLTDANPVNWEKGKKMLAEVIQEYPKTKWADSAENILKQYPDTIEGLKKSKDQAGLPR